MNKTQLTEIIKEVIAETIRKVDGKYVVYPKHGGDRLGTHDMHGGYNNEEDDVIRISEDSKADNVATKSVFYQNKDLFEPKKKLIFEEKKKEESKLLDESNIKDLGQ